MIKSRRCGCGEPLATCELWGPILTRLYGDPAHWAERATPIVAARDDVVRLRNLPKLLRDGGAGHEWPALQGYRADLARLYTAIANGTGARVVVNSSKLPHQGAAEMAVPGVDLYLVHLVRDPRSVAFSMLRKTMLQPDPDDPVEMPRSGVVASTLGWVRANLGCEAVRHKLGPQRSMLVRYEDLATDPGAVIGSIAALVGEPGAGLDLGEGSTATLTGNHTVWGNSFRFKKGPTKIRLDEEWKAAMPSSQRLLATAVAAPMLRRYGYPFASDGSRGAAPHR
jgi:hypothetical protein